MLLCLAGQVGAWDEPAQDRLADGQVVVEPVVVERGKPARVKAAIQIPAQVRSVWSVMTDCVAAPEFVPNLQSCEVLERQESYELIQHRVKFSMLLPRVTYVFRADYTPRSEIAFERVSGGLRHLSGRWRLTELSAELTQVDYEVALRPGFPVPRWLVRRSLKKDLPKVLRALRARVTESAPR